jgi:hypothetical protein
MTVKQTLLCFYSHVVVEAVLKTASDESLFNLFLLAEEISATK